MQGYCGECFGGYDAREIREILASEDFEGCEACEGTGSYPPDHDR